MNKLSMLKDGTLVVTVDKETYEKTQRVMVEVSGDVLGTLFYQDGTSRPTGEWIPVSERLPEEKDSLFKNKFFDKTSDTVLVTVADRKGQKTTTYAHTIDGKWSCDLLAACSDYKIIAWQPLPEPYKRGEE